MTREQATTILIEAGAKLERREDSHGETKSGWWIDGVFLSKNAVDAVAFLQGN